MNRQPTGLDYESYLATLVMDPEQSISRIYAMDGAGLYKITDDHYVIVCCSNEACHHGGRPLLERVLPRNWECFYSAINPDENFEVFHYGPAAV